MAGRKAKGHGGGRWAIAVRGARVTTNFYAERSREAKRRPASLPPIGVFRRVPRIVIATKNLRVVRPVLDGVKKPTIVSDRVP